MIHLQVFEKETCVSLLLFNSSGESHSSGGLGKSKFKSIFGEFSEVEIHEGKAVHTNTHTYTQNSIGVCMCLLWLVWWFLARTFAILFQGHSLHFQRCGGVGVVSPRPPQHPLLPTTISQALTSRSAAVCFKASN